MPSAGITVLSSVLVLAAAASVAQQAKVGGTAQKDSITVVSGPGGGSTVASAKMTVPTPATATTQAVKLAALLPLDLSDMRLWNWGGKWHASEWGDALSPIPWKFDHVTQPAGKDTYFKLDAAGAPELQAMGGTPVYSRGLWESDVTLPKLKDGLVVAPLWIRDANSRDEIDFEYAGRKGLDVTLHASLNGAMQQSTVRLFAGRDMSGQRHRFGIKADPAFGYVEMYVDEVRVQRWERNNMPFFVSHSMKPMISMWAADPSNPGFVSWVGKWPGLTPNETLKMTVHGYGYTALP